MGDNERPGRPTSTGRRRWAPGPAWRLRCVGLVVALGLAAVPPAHPAPSEAAAPGTWHGLGEGGARSEHTATLLARACPAPGRLCGVLVAGGCRDGAALASAEVFEPTDLRWEPTAPLATARSGHTATLVGDGRVLVTGGRDGLGSPLASVEIFEPDSARRLPDGSFVPGIWVAAPPMGSARAGHTATLLGDGRVLVAGGTDGSGAAVATAEVFDPIAGAWTAVAPMAKGRAGHAAARPAGPACTGPSPPAPCRTVVVTGGTAAAGELLASTEAFDPATGTWSTLAPMSTPRSGHSATALADGRIAVVGAGSAQVLDPTAAAGPVWGPPVAGGPSGAGHAAALLGGAACSPAGTCGQVLTVGGRDAAGAAQAGASVFDPSAGSWRSTGPLITARSSHSLTALATGELVVAGGTDGARVLGLSEAFDPASVLQPPSVVALSPGAAPAQGGTPVTLSGAGLAGATSVRFGAAEAAFSVVSASTIVAISPPGELGTVLVTVTTPAGSSLAVNTARFRYARPPAVTEVSPDWGPTSGGTLVRVRGTSFAFPGTTVRFGEAGASDVVVVSDTELTAVSPPHPQGAVDVTVVTPIGTSAASSASTFTYTDGAWEATAPMASPRYHHSATVLDDGRVLVVGGTSNFFPTGALASAEVYLPDKAQWAPAAPIRVARFSHTATLLRDGRVLVAGGQGLDQEEPFADDRLLAKQRTVGIDEFGFRNSVAHVLAGPDTGPAPRLMVGASPPPGSTLAPGSEITYTLAPYNTGGAATTDVVVSDLLAPEVEFVAASDGGHFDAAANAVVFPAGPVPTGGPDPSRSLEITVRVKPGASGMITNIAEVNGTASNPVEHFAPALPVEAGQLQVAQSSVPPSGSAVVPGQLVTYTLAVFNPGQEPLTDVRVLDVLPTDGRSSLYLDFVSASAGATFDAAARRVRYPPVTLAPGTSAASPAATFTMTVRVRASPSQESLDDAELFDPRTGQWAPTGSLHRARFSHTATLLPDGKVLVVGGTYTEDQRPPVPVAELYDPDSGVWSVVDVPGGCRAEPASCGRTNHSATLLADGTVLVAGGMAVSAEPPGAVTNAATIGVRGSNAVTHLGTAKAAPGVRLAVSASPPAGGPVQPGDEVSYTIAYFNSGLSPVSGVVDVTLPAAAEFVSATAGATLDTPDGAGRAALRFAPVVVAPGTTAESPAGSLSLRVKVRSEVPRTSTEDPDDVEPVADGTVLELSFEIRPDGNEVAQGDGAHHIVARARPGPSVHLLATSNPPPTSRVVRGTRITYTFSTYNLGGAPARDVVVRDVIGPGFDFVAASPGASFDPRTRVVTFAPTDIAPSTTASAPAGSVFVTVAVRGATLPTRTAETYDHLATGDRWAPAGSMAVARLSHSATLLDAEPCGAHCAKVLVAGGTTRFLLETTRFLLDQTADRPVFTSSMELYDPVTRTWASPAAGLLSQPRSGHTATRLTDGTVLFAGSAMSFPVATRPDPLASSEIYDPASDSRRSTASMLEARGLHTASLLDRPTGACAANPPPPYCDGVLVVGGAVLGGEGLNPPPTRAAEIYRPSTPALAVSAIVPSAGPSVGGTVVRIRGSGLGRVTAVRFGDLPAASFRVDSPAQISAVTPPHPKGTVVVTVLGGADSSVPVEVARFGFVVSRPPGKVTDLEASAGTGNDIELRFPAPPSDGPFEPAAQRYVVKQSLTPIVDEAGFSAATSLCEGECRLSPRRVGEALSLAVTELAAATTYHYAVRAMNEIDQVGPVSDSVVATTPASPGTPLSATAAPAAAAGRIGTGATTPPSLKRPTRRAAAPTTTVSTTLSVTGATQPPTLPTLPIPADPPFDTPLPQAFAPAVEDARGGMPRWAYTLLWLAALVALATVGAFGNRRYRDGR